MSNPYDPYFNQAIQTLRQEQRKQINQLHAHFRRELKEKADRSAEGLKQLADIANAMTMMRTGGDEPGIVRIEDIPGRRVPFTLLVDIPIGNNTTSVREQSVTISQEGPFIAVKRMAVFQSALEFQATNEVTGQTSRLAGRSFGRYRPIHSASDIADSQHAAKSDTTGWFALASAGPPAAGTVLPTGTLAQPSNMSSFRTMEFDGRVVIENAGSSFPRQNISVPTAFWTQYIQSPFELGALDFFERGEVLTIKVQPTHVNNPSAGNVDGECVFPAAAAAGFLGYPFVAGQYDSHEGICTPNGVVMGDSGSENDWEPSTSDPVTRLPDGILTIGWEGYRIRQPIAPVA